MSPEDNDASEVGWLATSLQPRLHGNVSSRTQHHVLGPPVDLESTSATTHPNQRNVGKAMLMPFIIFLMILSPVLIPTAVTIVNVMQGNHRPATTAGFASRRLVPAA
ncbi:MAG: hypothetical protein WCF69_09865 [Mycobacterium sp.]